MDTQTAVRSRRWRTVTSCRAMLAILVVVLAACSGAPDDALSNPSRHPGTPAGLAEVAQDFLRSGADPAALTADLRPSDADYTAVFPGDLLVPALIHYEGYWKRTMQIGAPVPGQTEFRVVSTTSADLATGAGNAREFSGGYRAIAALLTPGMEIHQIVFHEPGKSFGMRLEGLTYVNGRWRVFPEPWAVLQVNEPGHQH